MTCRYPVIGSLCAFAVESLRTRWISTSLAYRASFIKHSENARPEAERALLTPGICYVEVRNLIKLSETAGNSSISTLYVPAPVDSISGQVWTPALVAGVR